MEGNKKTKQKDWLDTLNVLEENSENSPTPFHDKARLDVTRKFLKYSLILITALVLSSFAYNALISFGKVPLEAINIGNVISLVVGQLGTSLGLIIGFYFKDKS